LKINIDGAFVQDSCEGAVGAVVHSSLGQLRVASARQLSSVGLALLAEIEALREGACLIPVGTQDHIVAKTDCQVLVSL
jgi:ribonuclease HI